MLLSHVDGGLPPPANVSSLADYGRRVGLKGSKVPPRPPSRWVAVVVAAAAAADAASSVATTAAATAAVAACSLRLHPRRASIVIGSRPCRPKV